MTKNIKICLLMSVAVVVLFSGVFVVSVLAEDPFDDIVYPISELGNCVNEEACLSYCDDPEHVPVCLDFAEAHNLMTAEEIKMARRMGTLGEIGGPGGCRTHQECKIYCDDIDHIVECMEFAEEHDMMPEEDIEEARKMAKAIAAGIEPPDCKSKNECDVYCSKSENMEQCMEFAIAAGFMTGHEAEQAKKMLVAIKSGITPPDCQGREQCDIYCSEPEHMEECMEFALAAGFMTEEEAEGSRRSLKAIRAGITPPSCRSDEECKIYCSKPENMEQCMEFSIVAGFAPPEEIENMRRTLEAIRRGILPPDCHSEEECDIYCSQDEHFQECIDFSEATGFMSPEEAEKARITGGRGPGGCKGDEECRAFCDNPDNMEECARYSLQVGDMTQEEFEKEMRGGPGGCRTQQECEAYCNDPINARECIKDSVESGYRSHEEGEQMLRDMDIMEQNQFMNSDEYKSENNYGKPEDYIQEEQRFQEDLERLRIDTREDILRDSGVLSEEEIEQILREKEEIMRMEREAYLQGQVEEGRYEESQEWNEPTEWEKPQDWVEPEPWQDKPQDWVELEEWNEPVQWDSSNGWQQDEPKDWTESNGWEEPQDWVEPGSLQEPKEFDEHKSEPSPQTFLGPIELFLGQILNFSIF